MPVKRYDVLQCHALGDYIHTDHCELSLHCVHLQVNLRHLREDITLLAARLRQHKAHVPLAPEFKDLLTEVGAS